MANLESDADARDIVTRLKAAETAGLRLALMGRSIALLPVAFWFISLGSERTGIIIGLVLLVFAGAGFGYRAIVGSRWDRPVYKYLFFTVDIAAIGAVFAFVPLSQGGDVPQVIVYRTFGIYYFFIVFGAAALTLSPRLLLWCGVAIAGVWWGVFLFITSNMSRTVSWGDLPQASSAEAYLALVLDPDFVGQGNRFEESVAILLTAILLAIAVHRARRMVRDWASAESARSRTMEMFGNFVPSTVVDRLVRDPQSLAPARQEATVLFLDIAGFTSLSESRAPEEVIAILNEVFDAAGEIIGRHGGIVTNLQGDGMLAVFNAPVALPGHARAAIAAARGIAADISGRKFQDVEIEVRLGVHSGPVAAGVVGGGQRRVYTVYGDTVNVAARLEQANKEFDTVVLASGEAVADGDAPGLESLGETTVRGHSARLTVYGVRRGGEPAAAEPS